MKRTILFLLASIFLLMSELAVRSLVERHRPVPRAPPSVQAILRVPEERAIETTLAPVIITVRSNRDPPQAPLARMSLNAAVPPSLPPAPEIPDLRCGAWKPLATDEAQTVRYCEPR